MMYAKDAAHAILVALDHGLPAGTYNAGNSEALTDEEIAEAICAAMSPELHVLVENEPEMFKPSYMDVGYKAQFTLKSTLPEIYRDIQMADV